MREHERSGDRRSDRMAAVGVPQAQARDPVHRIGQRILRIWIVNLLLTIVTASLYWPFAKARRIRYFYANTLVDGHALTFHGDPWKMFRGHVLLLVLMGTYSAAGHFSPMAGLVAFVVMAAIWPALWRAGMQFRLGNTGWRGLRFGFTGTLKGAYAPGAAGLAPLGRGAGGTGGRRPGRAAGQRQAALIVEQLVLLAVLGITLVMPMDRRGGQALPAQRLPHRGTARRTAPGRRQRTAAASRCRHRRRGMYELQHADDVVGLAPIETSM